MSQRGSLRGVMKQRRHREVTMSRPDENSLAKKNNRCTTAAKTKSLDRKQSPAGFLGTDVNAFD